MEALGEALPDGNCGLTFPETKPSPVQIAPEHRMRGALTRFHEVWLGRAEWERVLAMRGMTPPSAACFNSGTSMLEGDGSSAAGGWCHSGVNALPGIPVTGS